MEYYYDKRLKSWCNGDNRQELSDTCSKVAELRNARKNKKYLIVNNRRDSKRQLYPGLDADLIYFDISDVKLKLDNKAILYHNGKFVKSVCGVHFEDIKNISILKNFKDDLRYVVRFVEDVSYLGFENESLKPIVRHNNYNSLCEESQLYYQIEGNDPNII